MGMFSDRRKARARETEGRVTAAERDISSRDFTADEASFLRELAQREGGRLQPIQREAATQIGIESQGPTQLQDKPVIRPEVMEQLRQMGVPEDLLAMPSVREQRSPLSMREQPIQSREVPVTPEKRTRVQEGTRATELMGKEGGKKRGPAERAPRDFNLANSVSQVYQAMGKADQMGRIYEKISTPDLAKALDALNKRSKQQGYGPLDMEAMRIITRISLLDSAALTKALEINRTSAAEFNRKGK